MIAQPIETLLIRRVEAIASSCLRGTRLFGRMAPQQAVHHLMIEWRRLLLVLGEGRHGSHDGARVYAYPLCLSHSLSLSLMTTMGGCIGPPSAFLFLESGTCETAFPLGGRKTKGGCQSAGTVSFRGRRTDTALSANRKAPFGILAEKGIVLVARCREREREREGMGRYHKLDDVKPWDGPARPLSDSLSKEEKKKKEQTESARFFPPCVLSDCLYARCDGTIGSLTVSAGPNGKPPRTLSPVIHQKRSSMSTAAQRWPRPMASPSRAAITIPVADGDGAPVKASNGLLSSKRARNENNGVTDDEKRAFLEGLAMTKTQIDEAENTPQRTTAWFAYRRDRLSASLFGGAAGHNKYETRESVIRKMLWSEPFGNAATEYGTALEAAAFASVQVGVASALKQRGYGTVWFEETGTRVFAEHPWLCASADGIVHAVDGPTGAPTLRGVLELKAPFKKTFYEPTPHYYFDQFSGQARIHNTDFIVFGVYTPTATQINYFERDAKYWDEVLFPALQDFYMNHYMWRAILRDRGRIQRPNIDPHPCISISPFDFENYDRIAAYLEHKAKQEVESKEREDQERTDRAQRLQAAIAIVPDPWESQQDPLVLHPHSVDRLKRIASASTS